MTVIELAEHGPAVELRCDSTQGRALAASGVVDAQPASYGDDLWFVRDAGKVGVAQIGDMEIWIQPKVRVDRLLFLLGYLINPRGWRDDTAGLRTVDDLLPALAQSLWRQAERALARGLLQGYREHEDTSPVLRGRLRETDQMRRHHGLPMPLEVRYDEFTTDIAENRILRAGIERMLAMPRVDAESRRKLRRLRVRLGDIASVTAGTPLPAWQPSRLNARYHVALALAELVWRGASVEHAAGGTAVNGFLLDMPKLFEDFVTVALSEELTRRGGNPVRQAPCTLDVAGRVAMRPDLVWYDRGAPIAVADAKYKAEQPSGYPDADLYQVLAYCTALKLPHGHLIYAKGNAERDHHTVRNSGTEIHCHALDLQQPPDVLLGQLGTLAAEIAKFCPQTG